MTKHGNFPFENSELRSHSWSPNWHHTETNFSWVETWRSPLHNSAFVPFLLPFARRTKRYFVWPTLLRTAQKRNSCVRYSRKMCVRVRRNLRHSSHYFWGKYFSGILCVLRIDKCEAIFEFFGERKIEFNDLPSLHNFFFLRIYVVEVGNEINLSLRCWWWYFPSEVTHTHTHSRLHQHKCKSHVKISSKIFLILERKANEP